MQIQILSSTINYRNNLLGMYSKKSNRNKVGKRKNKKN